jgi:hypothetical protein
MENNTTVKNIVSEIKGPSKISNTNNPSKTSKIIDTSLVDKITVNIKNKLYSNLKYWLFVAIPAIVLLCFLLYKYNFSNRSGTIISNMNYKKNLNHKPLLQCYQQDLKYQFKFCDYYFSASYMTPCIGNQHYDYVSSDMITEVLQSGARYIQIPICEADVTLQSLPVVGTAEYGTRVITSINTLDIPTVFKTIRGNAFKLKNMSVNYPLIIHLILNTTNSYTLSVVADHIQEILSDLLVDVSAYIKVPIFLEKMCNLLGKIIIIATPEYHGTKLESYIVPTTQLFNIYHYSELADLNLPKDTIYKNSYNNKLSSKQQSKSALNFSNKYQDKTKGKGINYIVANASSIGDEILKDKDILNNLTSFNKVGVTIIVPHHTTDTASLNYDVSESIYYGCQIICMNFQINDDNMKQYLEIFKDSSFRLKPSSMRFTEVEEPITDLLSLYQNIMVQNNNILNDFYGNYNSKLISFESYASPNTYLTQIDSNFKFNLGTNKLRTRTGQITYKIGINQCFIVSKSTIGASDNISMYIESASSINSYVTLNNKTFILQALENNKKGLINQAFYFEVPKTEDNENPNKGQLVSIRTYDDKNPLYVAFENSNIKAYVSSPQIEAHNNMTFYVKEVKANTIIKIITLFDGSLISTGSNLIGVLETNTTNGTPYIVTPTKPAGGTNFNIFKDQFTLQNKNTKNYLGVDEPTGFLYDKYQYPNTTSIFSINHEDGYYNIVNTKKQKLILFNNNLIKFVDPNAISSNEDLFKLDISYDLLE